jgi:hypothetical protein
MSAGTGLTHSEFNLAGKPVHFYQIWIYPDAKGLKPTYDQRTYTLDSFKDRLFPVASGQKIPDTVTFHTDATIYRSELEAGREISFGTDESRRLFVYLTEGKLEINGSKLSAGCQARIDLESQLKIKAVSNAGFILIDVPSCKGYGYDKKTLNGSKK